MHHTSPSGVALGVIAGIVVAIAALIVGVTIVGRRRGYTGMGGETVVRCRDGHLFTTVWVPGVSLKAIRWGWLRYQHCPVGNHWAWVTPVDVSELTNAERHFASTHRDSRLP